MERQTYLTPYGECEMVCNNGLWICSSTSYPSSHIMGCGRTKALAYEDYMRWIDEANNAKHYDMKIDPTEYLC